MSTTGAAELLQREYSTLALELQDRVLTVTVTRPKALNALSETVITELEAVLTELTTTLHYPATQTSSEIAGVVLTGAGDKSFIAGADISQMREMTAADATEYAAAAHRVTRLLSALPVPVIAAVNGYALGGGCEIALACDYIYASENAVFGQPETALGLIPGFGGSVRLFRKVGVGVAREMILTGKKLSAAAALQAGLVNAVFASQQELLEAAHDSITAAGRNSPAATAAAKQVLEQVEQLPLVQGLELELESFAECFNTADMREGTAAFLEKRRPDFPGE